MLKTVQVLTLLKEIEEDLDERKDTHCHESIRRLIIVKTAILPN